MQIKNKNTLILITLFSLLGFTFNLQADEFNISASEVSIDKKNEIVVGTGSVVATDSEGKKIKANKITYTKMFS